MSIGSHRVNDHLRYQAPSPTELLGLYTQIPPCLLFLTFLKRTSGPRCIRQEFIFLSSTLLTALCHLSELAPSCSVPHFPNYICTGSCCPLLLKELLSPPTPTPAATLTVMADAIISPCMSNRPNCSNRTHSVHFSPYYC